MGCGYWVLRIKRIKRSKRIFAKKFTYEWQGRIVRVKFNWSEVNASDITFEDEACQWSQIMSRWDLFIVRCLLQMLSVRSICWIKYIGDRNIFYYRDVCRRLCWYLPRKRAAVKRLETGFNSHAIKLLRSDPRKPGGLVFSALNPSWTFYIYISSSRS